MLPNITTERLHLRCIHWSDLDRLHSMLSLPRFRQASKGCGFPESEKILARWIRHRQINHQRGLECCYAICLKQATELGGIIYITPESDDAELSFWLHPELWSQGYMREGLNAVLPLWHEKKNNPVYTIVHRSNTSSLRLISHFPFYEITGKEADCLTFKYKKSL